MFLVTGHSDNYLRVYDLDNKCIQDEIKFQKSITNIQFSGNDKFFSITKDDNELCLF